MKIFLSWSGNESKQLASIFQEWLPNVLQYVNPYMSAKDISKGEIWNDNIRENLEESVFGLVFVTPSNINSPWINYEAGALSKTKNARVVPLIYEAEVTILNQGPLKQFQSGKDFGEESIFSLLESINDSSTESKLDEARLRKAFDVWWPDLEESIKGVVKEKTKKSTGEEPSQKEILNLLVHKVTEQERFLRNTQNTRKTQMVVPIKLVKDLQSSLNVLIKCRLELNGGPYQEDFFQEIESGIDSLDSAIGYLANRSRQPIRKASKDEMDIE